MIYFSLFWKNTNLFHLRTISNPDPNTTLTLNKKLINPEYNEFESPIKNMNKFLIKSFSERE